MKSPLLILFLAFTLSINAQKKEDTGFYIMKDSTFTLWTASPNSLCDPMWEQYMVDASGDLFKVPTKYPNINRPMKLTPGGWVTWEKGLGPESINRLETDGRGLIFAMSRDHLYLLQDSAWKEIPTSAYGYPPKSFSDGGLYRLRDEKGGDDTYYGKRNQIMRWSENGYQPCGIDGKALFLQRKTDRFMVDRKGRIYSYEDHEYGTPQGPVQIYLYTEGEWQSIGTMPADIIFYGFDMENHLYVNGWDDDHNSYFKKWDGQSWTDIALPQGTELRSGILYDEALNVYVEGKDKTNSQSVLFRHEGTGWKEVARSDKGKWVEKFIPTTGDIYAVMDEGRMVQKYAGRWIVRQMEVANIPVNPIVNSSPDFTGGERDITLMKLFRQDGKLGIQDKEGRVWVYPAFDRISVEKVPQRMVAVQGDETLIRSTKFCVQMIAGADTAFIPVDAFRYSSPDPGQLRAFRKKTSRSCSTCRGAGSIPDKEEKVKVRGEWVEGKTSYSSSGENVWYPSCNCYVYTTTVVTKTTSSGYYKDAYETVKIPGGTCPACKGKGAFYAFEMYIYDARSGRYTRQWI